MKNNIQNNNWYRFFKKLCCFLWMPIIIILKLKKTENNNTSVAKFLCNYTKDYCFLRCILEFLPLHVIFFIYYLYWS